MDNPKHRNTVEFQVSGKYALFTDVLTRTGGERCTYMIPTYEALKGVLHSIYWKPTLIWYIDAVRVMKPIRTVRKGIRSNTAAETTSPITPISKMCAIRCGRILSGTGTIRSWNATAMSTSTTTLQGA